MGLLPGFGICLIPEPPSVGLNGARLPQGLGIPKSSLSCCLHLESSIFPSAPETR
jgi:hypothetical protein